MLQAHGLDWHRRAYPPSSWICPLCNDGNDIFTSSDELASHLVVNHKDIFEHSQVQDIVQQSQIQTLRPRNKCLICCLSIEVQRGSLLEERLEGIETAVLPDDLQDDEVRDRDIKRMKKTAGHMVSDQRLHDERTSSFADRQHGNSETSSKQHTAVSVAKHIAGHLQAIMALTLRMISAHAAVDASEKVQSFSSGTDERLSTATSAESRSNRDFEGVRNPVLLTFTDGGPNDAADVPPVMNVDEQPRRRDLIPDNPAVELDEVLMGVIRSGAFQSHYTEENVQIRTGNVYGDLIFDRTEDSLKNLPYAFNAPFNAYHRQHDADCLPGTREDVLKEIYKWIDGDEKSCIFWLNGWPGTGKSAIARTVARRYHADGRLAASFFFARGGGDCSHAGLFVTSIARQLADNKELGIQQIIHGAFDSQIPKQTLQEQWTQLVVQPLSRYAGGGDNRTFLVVIDALDECEEEGSIGILLHLLPQVGGCGNIRVRILVTSRPEPPIRHGFDQMETAAHQGFVLHRMPTEVSDRDIEIYLEQRLSTIGMKLGFDSRWPGNMY
jgi:hypothetical protein